MTAQIQKLICGALIMCAVLTSCEMVDEGPTPMKATGVPGAFYYSRGQNIYGVNKTASPITFFSYTAKYAGDLSLETLVSQGILFSQQTVMPFGEEIIQSVAYSEHFWVWPKAGKWHYNGAKINPLP